MKKNPKEQAVKHPDDFHVWHNGTMWVVGFSTNPPFFGMEMKDGAKKHAEEMARELNDVVLKYEKMEKECAA